MYCTPIITNNTIIFFQFLTQLWKLSIEKLEVAQNSSVKGSEKSNTGICQSLQALSPSDRQQRPSWWCPGPSFHPCKQGFSLYYVLRIHVFTIKIKPATSHRYSQGGFDQIRYTGLNIFRISNTSLNIKRFHNTGLIIWCIRNTGLIICRIPRHKFQYLPYPHNWYDYLPDPQH